MWSSNCRSLTTLFFRLLVISRHLQPPNTTPRADQRHQQCPTTIVETTFT